MSQGSTGFVQHMHGPGSIKNSLEKKKNRILKMRDKGIERAGQRWDHGWQGRKCMANRQVRWLRGKVAGKPDPTGCPLTATGMPPQ